MNMRAAHCYAHTVTLCPYLPWQFNTDLITQQLPPELFLFCTNLLQQPQPAHSECTPLSLYIVYTVFYFFHNSAAV